MAAHKGYKTPLGLNRHVLLIWYAFIVWITGYFVGGVDAMRRVLYMNDTAGYATETKFDQRVAIESICNVGFGVASAASWFVARWASHRDIKRTAIISTVLFAAGALILVMSDMLPMNYLGIIIMASTFSASFNAHVSIGPLFPDRSELVFDVMGAAPDGSALIPLVWIYLADNITAEKPMQAVVQGFAVIVIASAVLQLILFPSKPFTELTSKKYRKQMEELPRRPHKYTKPIVDLPPLKRLTRLLQREEQEDVVLGDLTVVQQVMHPLFTTTSLFFAFNLFRKYHLMSTFRFTLLQYAEYDGSDPKQALIIIEALNIAAGLSWLPTAFITRITNQTGALTSSAITYFFMLVSFVCYAIPSVQLQWVTVFSFSIWSSFIFSNLFGVLTDYFGARYVANLQGLQMIFGGLLVLAHQPIMELVGQPFIQGTKVSTDYGPETGVFYGIPLFHTIHIIMAAFSLVMVFTTLYEAKVTIPHYFKLRKLRDARREEERRLFQEEVKQAQMRLMAPMTQAPPTQALPPVARPPPAPQTLIGGGGAAQQQQDELFRLLDLFNKGPTDPSMSEEKMADMIFSQMSTMGLDPELILEDEEETVQLEAQGVRRLSIRPDGSSRRGSAARLIPSHRRRSSLNKIRAIGTGAAFLDETAVAELAGQLLADEAAKRFPSHRRGSASSDYSSSSENDAILYQDANAGRTASSRSSSSNENSMAETGSRPMVEPRDDEHQVLLTMGSTYGRPAGQVSSIAIPPPEGRSGSALLHHDASQNMISSP